MVANQEVALEVTQLVAIILIVGMVCAIGFGIVSTLKSPELVASVLARLTQTGSIIRLGTILTIVVVVFVLRLFEKIPADATITLLSGIAGYVLGAERRPGAKRSASGLSPDKANGLEQNAS
ncbi:MAG TPA: hypothetical protein VGH23_01645 [Rhizomicrobium sp.]|jgi:hypothetical protein